MISVVKIGGHVLDDEAQLKAFCRDFAALDGPKVLVHGGGALTTRLQRALGQEPVKIAGRRVTDEATLEVVTMACAGWCNKQIVSLLQAEGCQAAGFSGCDANLIRARRRAPLEIDGKVVDFGAVGDVTPASVNVPMLQALLSQGVVPVLSPINHDGEGQLLNTNADTVAASVAAALGAELYLCFEKDGVLANPDDPQSVLPRISKAVFQALKSAGTVSDGMLPKLENAFKALQQGAVQVVIKSASRLLSPVGTVLVL